MRTIQVGKITEEVAQMCKEAAYYLPKDVYEALKKGRETEESPVGRDVLDQIIKNAEIAKQTERKIGFLQPFQIFLKMLQLPTSVELHPEMLPQIQPKAIPVSLAYR